MKRRQDSLTALDRAVHRDNFTVMKGALVNTTFVGAEDSEESGVRELFVTLIKFVKETFGISFIDEQNFQLRVYATEDCEVGFFVQIPWLQTKIDRNVKGILLNVR